LNLRPLGPERPPISVDIAARLSMPSQVLDIAEDGLPATVEEKPPDTPSGAGGEAFPEPLAADLRRTGRQFLRPEDLLTVAEVAERLGVTASTVHNLINAGKLKCHRLTPDLFLAAGFIVLDIALCSPVGPSALEQVLRRAVQQATALRDHPNPPVNHG
jgi:hypothetical protein